MAELNLKQIADKLNEEFTGGSRKLVFWYDAEADFASEIDQLVLNNAKVYHLDQDNQFYTKYFLERLDKETSYLIYAPFPKPDVQDNHLADTIRYSKEFFADRVSLICVDLGIPEALKPVLQEYAGFFRAKDRTDRFYKLEIDRWTQEAIEVGLLSALCKTQALNFEEVVRVVLTSDGFEDNKHLKEFEKYGLTERFWHLVSLHLGYTDTEPTLKKLAMTLFITYAQKEITKELPKDWASLISVKTGNVVVFMENIMNNIQYRECFDGIAAELEETLQIHELLRAYPVDTLIGCDAFACIDDMILGWIVERLLDGNYAAMLEGKRILDICDLRKKTHFSAQFTPQYEMVAYAFHILNTSKYSPVTSVDEAIKEYSENGYLMDRHYREFYERYDRLTEREPYEGLRQLVENVYLNDHLNPACVNWNQCLKDTDLSGISVPQQRRFYQRYLSGKARAKTIVVISDALRYEVGVSLADRLLKNENCASLKVDKMLSVLPSITKTGMAALLPHKEIKLENNKVTVDGLPCAETVQRQSVLQKADPQSRCLTFEEADKMDFAALSDAFRGMNTIYIYHNQIDARGDKQLTENEVFTACTEAVTELYNLIIKLARNKMAAHFLVTADHGFIYKRDQLNESEKISVDKSAAEAVARRYVISDAAVNADGVVNYQLANTLGAENSQTVSVPLGADVFKASGGSCYVHGGASIQEMLIPVIDMTTKTGKQKKDIQKAQISLVSILNKVTNLITPLDFIQNEPISDVVSEAKYRIFFVDAEGNKISSENTLVANSKDTDAQKRITRLKFRFKDMQYSPNAVSYLVVYDDENEYTPVLQHEVRVDMAFASDFGF